jgi:CrcB protein
MMALYVALGAALGALARYFLGGWVAGATGSAFPWGTLVVNLLGCLVVGLAWGVAERALWAPPLRTFFFIGVLGAFTTFSTFGLETVNLLRDAEYVRALGYALGSNLGGLFLVWLGLALIR